MAETQEVAVMLGEAMREEASQTRPNNFPSRRWSIRVLKPRRPFSRDAVQAARPSNWPRTEFDSLARASK